MCNLRLIALTALAILGVAGSAAAQSTSGSIRFRTITSGHGGTTAKPVATGLTFSYANADPGGLQLAPVRAFKLFVDFSQITSALLPVCTVARMNAAQTDAGCPAASKLGSGSLDAVGGRTGTPVASGAPCLMRLTLFNAGRGRAAMWIVLTPPSCPLSQQQAVNVRLGRRAHGVTMAFSLPRAFLNLAGLDVSVLRFAMKIRRITRLDRHHRRRGYVESVCGRSRRRAYAITAVDRTGRAQRGGGSRPC